MSFVDLLTCVGSEINPRDGSPTQTSVDVNSACQIRVRNTERYRKKKLTRAAERYAAEGGDDEEHVVYSDNNPPVDLNTDAGGSEKVVTCPHYRQLTRISIASAAQRELAPSQSSESCCSVGGAKSKLGANDSKWKITIALGKSIHSLCSDH